MWAWLFVYLFAGLPLIASVLGAWRAQPDGEKAPEWLIILTIALWPLTLLVLVAGWVTERASRR